MSFFGVSTAREDAAPASASLRSRGTDAVSDRPLHPCCLRVHRPPRSPVRSTDRMPFKTARISPWCPRPSLRDVGSGIKMFRIFHCASVRSRVFASIGSPPRVSASNHLLISESQGTRLIEKNAGRSKMTYTDAPTRHDCSFFIRTMARFRPA